MLAVHTGHCVRARPHATHLADMLLDAQFARLGWKAWIGCPRFDRWLAGECRQGTLRRRRLWGATRAWKSIAEATGTPQPAAFGLFLCGLSRPLRAFTCSIVAQEAL